MSGAVPGAAELAAIRARNREFMAWWFERDPPFIPSVTTPYYEAMRDIAALLALVDALTGALDSLGRVWEGLCRCVDEFEPEYPAACDERRNDLYSAVERALEQARGGRDGGE